MTEQQFTATIEAFERRAGVPLPFDPDVAWGVKSRHHVAGTVSGCRVRAALDPAGDETVLWLGPAFLRDTGLAVGDTVNVVLAPEGPQVAALAPDIAGPLTAEPQARAFFEGLATYYRKNYINWIEEAKRPATRARRIEQMMALLREEKQQK